MVIWQPISSAGAREAGPVVTWKALPIFWIEQIWLSPKASCLHESLVSFPLFLGLSWRAGISSLLLGKRNALWCKDPVHKMGTGVLNFDLAGTDVEIC